LKEEVIRIPISPYGKRFITYQLHFASQNVISTDVSNEYRLYFQVHNIRELITIG